MSIPDDDTITRGFVTVEGLRQAEETLFGYATDVRIQNPFVSNNTGATELLDAAAKHMRDRAATYDKPEGERSIGKTIAAFNAITGRDLKEHEGWLLMMLLKAVRSEQRADPHQDSVEDLVAYGALYGEARLGGR